MDLTNRQDKWLNIASDQASADFERENQTKRTESNKAIDESSKNNAKDDELTKYLKSSEMGGETCDVEKQNKKIESDKAIEEFKSNTDDTEFANLIRAEKLNPNRIDEVRLKCKTQALRHNMDIKLFNRIPMYMFRYVSAEDPLCKETFEIGKLEIMCTFMLINSLSPNLIAAFHTEGGQSVENVAEILSFYTKMKEIYEKTPNNERCALFGTKFAYHLESKTLRRIDMTIVESKSRDKEPFIPDQMDWKRQRAIRSMVRNGQFTVEDDFDLRQVKMAWKNGLRLRGRLTK